MSPEPLTLKSACISRARPSSQFVNMASGTSCENLRQTTSEAGIRSESSKLVDQDAKIQSDNFALPPKVFSRRVPPDQWFSMPSWEPSSVVQFRARSWRFLKHLFVSYVLAGLMFGGIYGCIIGATGNEKGTSRLEYNSLSIVLPNNSTWSMKPDSCYQPLWSTQGIDTPVASELSFAGAKSVDLAWNWIAGRGIQLLFAWLAYQAFSVALLKTAEESHVPLSAVMALTMFATHPGSLWPLLRSFRSSAGWRLRFLVVWAILSTLMLAAFPALMDLSTGYEQLRKRQVTTANGQSIPADNLDITPPREPMHVTVHWPECAPDENMTLEDYLRQYRNTTFENVAERTWRDWCDTDQPRNYSPNATICCSFHASALPSPSDKLWRWQPATIHNLRWSDESLQRAWDGIFNESFIRSFANDTDDYAFSSQLGHEMNRFPRLGTYACQVTADSKYMWGFSYLWLTITLGVSLLWLLGLWVLWVDADHNSQFARKGRSMGPWRPALDVAGALNEGLGNSTGGYSNSELEKRVNVLPAVKYVVEPCEEGREGSRIGLSARPSARVRLRWDETYG